MSSGEPRSLLYAWFALFGLLVVCHARIEATAFEHLLFMLTPRLCDQGTSTDVFAISSGALVQEKVASLSERQRMGFFATIALVGTLQNVPMMLAQIYLSSAFATDMIGRVRICPRHTLDNELTELVLYSTGKLRISILCTHWIHPPSIDSMLG